MALTVFVTGTDTGVGKTILTTLLIRTLRARDVAAAAVKPLCSGGREDAVALLTAQALAPAELDAINPWHFREALTPLIAARRAGQAVSRADVVAFLKASAQGREMLVVEGAGGLLSPLGEGFDARDLIMELKAVPVLVAANRLGVLNQVLLTLDALPFTARKRAHLVLMPGRRLGLAERTNEALLAERLGADRIHRMPRLPDGFLRRIATGRIPKAAVEVLDTLCERLVPFTSRTGR